MTRDEIIETMARAHFERDGNKWDSPEMLDFDHEAFLADMYAAIAAAEAAGFAVVPKEPSLAMQNAGWREVDKQGFSTEDTEVAPIYRAMIEARPK